MNMALLQHEIFTLICILVPQYVIIYAVSILKGNVNKQAIIVLKEDNRSFFGCLWISGNCHGMQNFLRDYCNTIEDR